MRDNSSMPGFHILIGEHEYVPCSSGWLLAATNLTVSPAFACICVVLKFDPITCCILTGFEADCCHDR